MKPTSVKLIKLSLACLLLACVSGKTTYASPADLLYYDAVRDFSAEANPNGVWKYGWSEDLTGAFVLYTGSSMPGINNGLELGWDDPNNSSGFTPSVAINTGGDFDDGNVTFAAGALILHPCGLDGHAYSHVIWTSPRSGSYFVTSTFIAQQYTVDVDVNIRANGISVFASTLTHIDQYRWFSGILRVRAGQQIDFAVGPNGDFFLHPGNTGFQATILPVGR